MTERQSKTACDLEAEQRVLGLLMFDNEQLGLIREILLPIHFYEPFHQRLFAAIESRVSLHKLAEPIELTDFFRNDSAFQELGGIRYFADLVDKAPEPRQLLSDAQKVIDLAVRRELIMTLSEVVEGARTDIKSPISNHIDRAKAKLEALSQVGYAIADFVPFGLALRGALDYIIELSDSKRDRKIRTGWPALDVAVGSLVPSDVLLIYSAVDQSDLIRSLGLKIAKQLNEEATPAASTHRAAVALFSTLASPEQVALELLAEESGISADRIRDGKIDRTLVDHMSDVAERIEATPFFIETQTEISITSLAESIRKLNRSNEIRLVVVDELSLVQPRANYNRDMMPSLPRLLEDLSGMGEEYGVPILGQTLAAEQLPYLRALSRTQLKSHSLHEFGVGAATAAFLFRKSSLQATEKTPLHGSVRPVVTTARVLEVTSRRFGLSPEALLSDGRSRELSRIRQVAMYVTRELGTSSLQEIGRAFGGRDAATVLHAIRRIESDIVADERLAQDVAAVMQEVRGEGTLGLSSDDAPFSPRFA